MLVPVPVGVVLAVVFSPVMLVFTLMSPSSWPATRCPTDSPADAGMPLPKHAAAVERVEAAAAAAVRDEQRRRRWALPDSAEVLAIASVPSTRLWERRPADPDVLEVRVGTWTAPALLRIVDPGDRSTRRPEVADVPCPTRWARWGFSGSRVPDRRSGARPPRRGPAGGAALSPRPQPVGACGRPASRRSWRWVSRLPHCRASLPAGLTRQFAVLDASGEQLVRAVRELQETWRVDAT